MKLRLIIPGQALRSVARAFCLAVAVVCLGSYGYVYLQRTLYQAYESREWEFARVAVSNAAMPESAPASKAVRAQRRALPSGLLGRLSVPRLELSAMVREGVAGSTLRVAVGHIPGTALPGHAGNVGLAGHRDTFFRGLKDLKPLDEIRFSSRSGDYKYIVESLVVVEPDNLSVLAPSPGNVLTLVTCYPFNYVGTAPRRFVVRARQVSPETGAQAIVKMMLHGPAMPSQGGM